MRKILEYEDLLALMPDSYKTAKLLNYIGSIVKE